MPPIIKKIKEEHLRQEPLPPGLQDKITPARGHLHDTPSPTQRSRFGTVENQQANEDGRCLTKPIGMSLHTSTQRHSESRETICASVDGGNFRPLPKGDLSFVPSGSRKLLAVPAETARGAASVERLSVQV